MIGSFRGAMAVLAAALIGLSSTLKAQRTFEGTITYDATLGERRTTISISSRGNKVRQDFVMPDAPPEAQTYQIIDYDSGEIITVLPGMKQYMTLNLNTLRAGASPGQGARAERAREIAADVSATGRTETIAGVSCEVYVLKSAPGDEVCLTTALGHVLAFEGRARMAGGGASPVTGDLLSGALLKFSNGAAILRMRIRSKNEPMTMVASKIDRTPQPSSFFARPSGFTEINPMVGRP